MSTTSNEDAATVVGIVLIVLDILTVTARFYTRRSTKAGLESDDWTILMALLFGFLPGALTIWANSVSETGPAAASNFDPDYVFTPEDVLYTKITFSVSVLYFLVTCTTKMSLLLLYRRLFAVKKSYKVKIYVASAAVVGFWLSATVADVLNCVPLEWTWKNGNADPRHCFSYNTFWLATGVVEAVIDLIILALPLSVVWKLQLDRSKKIGVAGVFTLGLLVVFSGVVKVVLSYVSDSREPDFARSALWTAVHLYLGIICANLLPIWPLFSRLAKLSTGSWGRLFSMGKRTWYSLSNGQPSTDSESLRRSPLGQNRRRYDQAVNV